MNSMDTVESKRDKRLFLLVNCLMIGYLVLRILQRVIFAWNDLNRYSSSWGVTDYMINYQGGYVRRGLVGEIIYQMSLLNTFIDPRCYMVLISTVSIVLVVWFFIRNFRKHGLCWWILPLNVCLMGAYDLIRKDFLCALLVILTFHVCSHVRKPWLRLVVVMMLAGLSLNVHECTFFMMCPMLMWLFLREKGVGMTYKCLGVFIPVVLMAVVCFHKGDVMVAEKIWRSWASADEAFAVGSPCASIQAIGWETRYAVDYHLNVNFLKPSYFIYGWYSKPIVWCLIVFVTINVTFLHKRKENLKESEEVGRLLSILVFQFFSLLPMFTVLSCDGARICFYWLVSSMTVYFCIQPRQAVGLFPVFYTSAIRKLQGVIITRNSWRFATVAVLFLAISQNYTNLLGAIFDTVVGTYAYAVVMFLEKIMGIALFA